MTSLNGLIIAPIVAGLLVWLLARWPKVSAGAGAIFAFGIWLLLKTMTLPETAVSGTPIQLFGQDLVFNEGLQSLFLFIYGGLIILFLLAIPFVQGRKFVPGALGVMGLLLAGVMIRPFSVGIVIIWVALALVSIIIQEELAGATHGGVTYLVLVSVAMPLLLILVWTVETQTVNLVTPVTRFALIGVIILLGGFPFHIWVTSAVRESKPLIYVFLFGLAQLVVVTFIFNFFQAAPWLQNDIQFLEMVRLSGIATLLTIALLVMTAVRFSRLIDSLLLLDMSLVLLALLLPNELGWETAVTLQIGRFGALLFLAVGLLLLQRVGITSEINEAGLAEDQARSNQGLGRRAPLSLALFLFGAASLIGLPLTLGFAGHTRAIQSLGTAVMLIDSSTFLLITVFLAITLSAFALFRATLYWLKAPTEAAASAEPVWQKIILGIALFAGILFAFTPPTFIDYTQTLAQLFQ